MKWGARQSPQNATCAWYSQDLPDARYGDDVCPSMRRADNTIQVDGRVIIQFWYE